MIFFVIDQLEIGQIDIKLLIGKSIMYKLGNGQLIDWITT